MEARQESYRDWLIGRIIKEANDTSLVSKKGKKLTDTQRKVRAVLIAWQEVFGAAQPISMGTIVEFLSTLEGSPVKVTHWFLRNADHYPEGEDADTILLAKLKAATKAAGIQRTGIKEPEKMPLRVLPKLR